jgi:hypothetical protein
MKTEKEKTKPQQSCEDVTIAEVKGCQGFEELSDAQAQSIADAIRVYTEIIYNCFVERRLTEEKAKIITLRIEHNQKAA